MFGKGKHTSRELIRRLRSENRHFERQNSLLQVRLRKANELVRAITAERDIADALAVKQTAALQAKDSRIAELEQRLKAASDDTVEMPIPAELAAA